MKLDRIVRAAVASCLSAVVVAVAAPADATPPGPPETLTAWSGYHESVRLTWFPPFQLASREERATVSREAWEGWRGSTPNAWEPAAEDLGGGLTYRVYRAEGVGGDFALIADGLTHTWYRDDDVVNGRAYRYALRACLAGEESPPSEEATATPVFGGYRIRSGFTRSAPVLDGRIGAAEWRDARVVDITAPAGAAALPVTAYVMNSETHLYVAVRDPNFPFPDDFNQIGIYFDENHDGAWNGPPARPEGNIWIFYDATFNESNNWFRAVTGTWPHGIGFVQFGDVTTVRQRIGYYPGDPEFEVAIDLRFVPLVSEPGRTVGFAIYSDQTGAAPFTGEWPSGFLESNVYFTAAVLFGDLFLARRPETPVREEAEGIVAFPNPTAGAVTFRRGAAAGAGPASGDGAAAAGARLLVFDASGRRVAALPWSVAGARWDGLGEGGERLPAGVYAYRLERDRGRGGRLLLVR